MISQCYKGIIYNNNIWGGPLSLAELDTLIDDSVDNKLSSFDLSEFSDPSDFEKYLIIPKFGIMCRFYQNHCSCGIVKNGSDEFSEIE